jgi:hypothetical protein
VHTEQDLLHYYTGKYWTGFITLFYWCILNRIYYIIILVNTEQDLLNYYTGKYWTWFITLLYWCILNMIYYIIILVHTEHDLLHYYTGAYWTGFITLLYWCILNMIVTFWPLFPLFCHYLVWSGRELGWAVYVCFFSDLGICMFRPSMVLNHELFLIENHT